VVDDNPDQAEGIAFFLQMEGYEVCTAHDGATALDQARIHRPLVGILDIGLPGLDGYELARRLRAEPRLPKMTLVAVTGYGREEDRAAATSSGFDYHLVKPFEVQDLLALMPREARQEQL
jgi:two-component system CheB/CheR fusion protein